MSNLKVYLAAPYRMKQTILERTRELESLGIEVTSTWVQEPEKATTELHELSEQQHRIYAERDVDEVKQAYVLVFQGDETKTIIRAGRHVEFGIAVALDMQIFVVGPEKENIFHYLPNVVHMSDWETTKDKLAEIQRFFQEP